jgi:hypothetical protein
MKVTLDQEAFIFALAPPPCLFSNGPLGMVCELLQDCFVPYDSTNGFDLFFEICGHIVQGHVPALVSHLFSASRFLVLKKQSKGIRPLQSVK